MFSCVAPPLCSKVARYLKLAGFTVVLASIGCGDGKEPTAPSATPGQSVPLFPQAPAGSVVFNELDPDGPLYRGLGRVSSRYVFLDSKRFQFEIASTGGLIAQYSGSYTSGDFGLEMIFDATSAWTATGTIEGDLLIIAYSDWAIWDDFRNGIYVKSADQKGL